MEVDEDKIDKYNIPVGVCFVVLSAIPILPNNTVTPLYQ